MKIARRFATGLIPVLAFSGLSAACGPPPETGEAPDLIEDEVYVAVMAELMLLGGRDGRPEDEHNAAQDSLREGILAAHGVTADQILEFVEALGGEAGRMEGLWESIAHRYDSMRVARIQEETAAGSGIAPVDTGVASRQGTAEGEVRDSAAPAARLESARRRFARPPAKQPAARDTTAGSG